MSFMSAIFGPPSKSFFSKNWHEGAYFVIGFGRLSKKSDKYFPAIAASQLEKQLRYVQKCFELVTFDQILECAETREALPERAATITFEYGSKAVYDIAFPLLKKLNIPATVMLPAGLIDSDAILWEDEIGLLFQKIPTAGEFKIEIFPNTFRWADNMEKEVAFQNFNLKLKRSDPKEREEAVKQFREIDLIKDNSHPRMFMTWDEVKEMAQAGVYFGSNGMTYPILTKMTTNEAAAELQESKKIIEEKTGKPCNVFAYPGGGAGDLDMETEKFVRNAGYKAGVTNFPGLNKRTALLLVLERVLSNYNSVGKLGAELKNQIVNFQPDKDVKEKYHVIRGNLVD